MIRTLYVGQTVQIVTGPVQTGVGFTGRCTGYLPVSSASCEVTKPVEAVTAFGRLGSLALAQTNLTTCKSSIKTYLTSGAPAFNAQAINSGITAGFLASLTGDAVQGNYTVITVTPNGFIMSGILASMGLDMAVGGFGTADFTFNGIGQPYFTGLVNNATTEQGNMPQSLTPVTTIAVSGAILSGCQTSFKFALDMPTDNLSCLGDYPDMVQSSGMNSLIATKPPYKATITVEGYEVDLSTSTTDIPPANTRYSFGNVSVALPNGISTSKSFNQAVGTANASYNYTLEDTTANFLNS